MCNFMSLLSLGVVRLVLSVHLHVNLDDCVYCHLFCFSSLFISKRFCKADERPFFSFVFVVDNLHGSDVSECVLGVVCMGTRY